MIGRLNHVAIAVPDLEAAAAQYRDTLGADVGAPQDEPDHGVTVVFINLPNTKIELLYPLGENSPINGFLEKNPSGGIHQGNPMMGTGLVRFGEVAARIIRGEADRGMAHGTQGPCLQQNIVGVLEAE